MADTITVDQLASVMAEELALYHADKTARLDKLSDKAAKSLVRKTKASAPIGKRAGKYRDHIASKVKDKTPNGNIYAWYVKAPEYRLTHLLTNGHEKRNGGRTRGNPFLANALNEVLPDYESKVEELYSDG